MEGFIAVMAMPMPRELHEEGRNFLSRFLALLGDRIDRQKPGRGPQRIIINCSAELTVSSAPTSSLIFHERRCVLCFLTTRTVLHPHPATTNDPFASTESLSVNPFDDPSADQHSVNKAPSQYSHELAASRAVVLDHREQDLERRERELQQKRLKQSESTVATTGLPVSASVLPMRPKRI